MKAEREGKYLLTFRPILYVCVSCLGFCTCVPPFLRLTWFEFPSVLLMGKTRVHG